MMPVPKVMLSTLIDRTISVAKENGLKDKDIAGYRELFTKEAAKAALDLMKDSVLLMKKSYNLWTVLAVLQEYMKVSGINSDHKIEAGGKHVFIIQHELGQNWSEFTAQLIKMIFEELANVRANVMSTPNTVVAEVVL
jgi:ABC-type arginine transport system ATPase subunit